MEGLDELELGGRGFERVFEQSSSLQCERVGRGRKSKQQLRSSALMDIK